MSLSLKTIASDCLSLQPSFSVIRDVFGYIFGAPKRTMSLKRQLQLIKGPSLDINLILVGKENFDAHPEDFQEIQYGVQFTRDIYAKVDLGIRKINWQQISVADAGDYTTLDSEDAHSLTRDFNGPSGALDVFVVRTMTGASGRSAVDGTCSKDHIYEMTGSVVSLDGSFDFSGNTFAHEIGHYLGLNHIYDWDNFIGGGELDTDDEGASDANTGIYEWQGEEMKKHCYVKDIC